MNRKKTMKEIKKYIKYFIYFMLFMTFFGSTDIIISKFCGFILISFMLYEISKKIPNEYINENI